MRPSSATVRFAFFGNPGLVDRGTLVLGQNTCKRHDQNMRTAGLMDEFTISAVTVQFAVAAVDDKRDVSLFKDRADF